MFFIHAVRRIFQAKRDFLQDCCNCQTIDDLKGKNELIEIKNSVKSKIPKSALQTCALGYQNLFDFHHMQPQTFLEIYTI